MYNQDKKQKKGIIFSTAVIALGCVISALYANYTMNRSGDYSVDLSELDSTAENSVPKDSGVADNAQNDALTGAGVGAELAKVSGSDVVNPNPTLSGAQAAAELEKAKSQSRQNIRQSDDKDEEKPDDSQNEEASIQNTDQTMQAEQTVSYDTTLSFAPEDGMGWPLSGNVILGYSMDKSIFFETLQQYRYNPAIYIGAEVGEAVSACAKGQVVEIGEDAQIGNYVRMNLGSGYEVLYGQLSDLQVAEGDIVPRGQVIGKVGEVTRSYTVEGSHVYLKIEKDGEPVNPMELLQ